MASFSAQLLVAGHSYPVRQGTYEFTQTVGSRGRVTERVRMGLVYLTLDVPADDFLPGWAAKPNQPVAGQVVFLTAQGGSALETLSWEVGQCVGYREEFAAGDQEAGAYVCHLTIAAPKLTIQPGGPGGYASPQLAAASAAVAEAEVAAEVVASAPELVAEPPLGEIALELGKAALQELAPLVAAAAVPAALTLGLILLSSTPAGGPGIPQRHLVPVDPDALRLAYLEAQREGRALTPPEERELIALLAKVRGVHVSGPQDLAYLYSQDIAFNKGWDQHAPADLRQLDLQATLQHVEYRDLSVPRKKGIGGAHNQVEWTKHQADYVEVSRLPHATVAGVEQVNYKIYALDSKGQPTGGLVNEVFEKTVYDPAVWPRPRLERALREALADAYHANKGSLPTGYWEGVTSQGDSICGFHRANQIQTFFFK